MWLKNMPVAHRGLHDDKLPENSLAAFTAAAEKGFAIETDIQILADGTVVVFHDESLLRLCGADKKLYELTLEQIKKYHLLDTEEKIPTLREFLDTVDGRVPLLIEFKRHGGTSIPAVCEAAAKELDSYKGEFAVQAFHPHIVKWFHDFRPEVLRGQLSCYFRKEKLPLYQKVLLKRMFFNRKTKPHFVSYDVEDINSRFVRRARKKCAVLAWTVLPSHNLKDVYKYADNIIFEGFIPR